MTESATWHLTKVRASIPRPKRIRRDADLHPIGRVDMKVRKTRVDIN
jgi:hypothetical protein